MILSSSTNVAASDGGKPIVSEKNKKKITIEIVFLLYFN
jgi:hypothetical protein